MAEILRFNKVKLNVSIMCLSPIKVINPNKYISLNFRDRFLMDVPCGKCAECQSSKSLEWLYRAYQESHDVLDAGGFILFDTLTYNDSCLPHLYDMVAGCTPYPCFNHKHVTNFFKLLRIKLKRGKYNVQLRYFLSSEYGTDDRYTHRPHYHVLFYVFGNIDPIQLSQLISECWSYGRTDGFPWKSQHYVLTNNVLKSADDNGQVLRVANYVTKYVQKSCTFQKELDKRINNAAWYIANRLLPDDPSTWLESVHGKRVIEKLKRSVNQFHRQSLHFGETALMSLDLNELERVGCLVMPHFKGVKINIPLPMYYKRKLFYRLLVVDGCPSWQLTDYGIEFNKKRAASILQNTIDRYNAVCEQYNLQHIDTHRLADYVLNYRGRIKADAESVPLDLKLSDVTLFNYSHRSDKEHLQKLGISPIFLGNSRIGYRHPHKFISFRDFISKYVILDADREKEIALIERFTSSRAQEKQYVYEEKQRLTNLYKQFQVRNL